MRTTPNLLLVRPETSSQNGRMATRSIRFMVCMAYFRLAWNRSLAVAGTVVTSTTRPWRLVLAFFVDM